MCDLSVFSLNSDNVRFAVEWQGFTDGICGSRETIVCRTGIFHFGAASTIKGRVMNGSKSTLSEAWGSQAYTLDQSDLDLIMRQNVPRI